MSRSAKAANLAAKVARELVLQADHCDPMEVALRNVRAALASDPVLELATSADIGLHSLLEKARVSRFRARGCTNLSSAAWERETNEIEEEVRDRLRSRFRRP